MGLQIKNRLFDAFRVKLNKSNKKLTKISFLANIIIFFLQIDRPKNQYEKDENKI
jgi:hypothetical protein